MTKGVSPVTTNISYYETAIVILPLKIVHDELGLNIDCSYGNKIQYERDLKRLVRRLRDKLL